MSDTGLILRGNSNLPMIKDMVNDSPIEQALVMCFKYSGLRESQWPSKDPEYNEKKFLVKFIKEHYRTLKAEEIILAFKLAMAGKFEVDTKTYGQFTPEYFGRIMTAYIRYKSTFQKKPENTLIETGGISNADFLDKHLFKPYKALLNKQIGIFPNGLEDVLYDRLEKMGIKMSNKEITAKFLKQAQDIKSNRYTKTEKQQKDKLRRDLKRDLFLHWIKDCVEFEKDIEVEITLGESYKKEKP